MSAGVNAKDGQAAGIGVGHGLEDLGRQRAIRVRLNNHFGCRGGMLPLDRAAILRGGEIEINRVQQERGAAAVLAGPAQNRHETALQGADPESLVDLLRRQFPFFQEFLDQGVVTFRGKVKQIVPQRLRLILEVVGDGTRFQLAAPGRRQVGLLADQIHHPFETGFPADGQQDGHGLDLQHFPDFLERLVKIGPFPVHLIDEDQAGQIVPVGRVPDLFGAHLDAVHRVHHHHGGVGHMEGGPGIRQEIVIPGGVGQINRVLFPLIMVKGAGDGDLTFNFLRLVIQDGTAVVDFSQPGGGPRPKEEGLGQRGLAAAPMADQDQVADQCGFAGHQILPSLKVASPVPDFGEDFVWDRGNLLKLTGLSINLNRFSAPFPASFRSQGRIPGKPAATRRNGPGN